MRWVKTLLWILVVIFVVLYSIQNRSEVTIRFVLLPIESYQWFEVPQVPLPLFLLILGAVFLGVLIGGISDFYKRFQLRKIIRRNQKTIEKLEMEMQSLRSPVLDQPSFLKRDG